MSMHNDVASEPPPLFPQAWSAPKSTAERLTTGRTARQLVPRSSLAEIVTTGRDPLGILNAQNVNRVPELLPIRTQRMSLSEFTFYRGGAAIMAADHAGAPHSGILVPSCGDAHVSNFGFYASPLQTLVFDLNDFDEAAWAPWEWDLKRLIASVVIAGRDTSRDERHIIAAVRAAVRGYAIVMRSSLKLSPRARYLTHFDATNVSHAMSASSRRVIRRASKHARKRTGERAVRKLTTTDADGRLRFVETPPTMQRSSPAVQENLQAYLAQYLETANSDIRMLLHHYSVSDMARRVVGVGSVGTRCALVLLQDGDSNGMILQAKEAGRSVLEQYGGISQPQIIRDAITQHGEGGRVVALQRVLQGVSDPFLGYLRGEGIDLYVRQFHDMKGSIEAEHLDDEPFITYAQACGVTLARAHSQSLQSPVISGYLGSGRRMAELLLPWAFEYADLSRVDYRAFIAAASATEPRG